MCDEVDEDEVSEVASKLRSFARQLDERASEHNTTSRLAGELRMLAQRLELAIGEYT